MVKINIIAVGRIKEPSLVSLISEFQKRIRPMADLSITELKDEGVSKEAEKLEKYLSQDTYVLDETGKTFSSTEFAAFLKKRETPTTFIIGGPEGIDSSIKKQAQLISISKMTFTHEMARLFLVEQIYRACMINSGRGYYHK
jgi:23S rRNA (pseudouridine1915-N3)-methyltransferase